MFPRANRLRKSHDILTVFRRGTRRSSGPFTCHLIEAPGAHQVAVIVDKKVSKLATERNQVKRRVRAALQTMTLPSGKLIVRAHAGSVDVPYSAIHEHLTKCLHGRTSSS